MIIIISHRRATALEGTPKMFACKILGKEKLAGFIEGRRYG